MSKSVGKWPVSDGLWAQINPCCHHVNYSRWDATIPTSPDRSTMNAIFITSNNARTTDGITGILPTAVFRNGTRLSFPQIVADKSGKI